MEITFNKYQEDAMRTKVYDKSISLMYPALGLNGEAGEVAEKVKKIYRDDSGNISHNKREEISDELGDILWYVAAMCEDIGVTMDYVAKRNLDKLASRMLRNKIHGSGDKR